MFPFQNEISIVISLAKWNTYPLHTYCGGTRLCIRSSLLCEPVSLHVVIATSCDVVCSDNRQDLIQSLVHYLVYFYWNVISLSNISIKTHFKQITRVEIRLTNLYNTLGEAIFCAWRHVICCRSFFCFVYVAYIDVFLRIPMIWRHDKIVWQRRSRATSRHSFITTVLLSLSSKENVQNVR